MYSFDLDLKHLLTKYNYKSFIDLKYLTPIFSGNTAPILSNTKK